MMLCLICSEDPLIPNVSEGQLRILCKGMTQSHLTWRRTTLATEQKMDCSGNTGVSSSCSSNSGKWSWGCTEKGPHPPRGEGRALVCYCRMRMWAAMGMKASRRLDSPQMWAGNVQGAEPRKHPMKCLLDTQEQLLIRKLGIGFRSSEGRVEQGPVWEAGYRQCSAEGFGKRAQLGNENKEQKRTEGRILLAP